MTYGPPHNNSKCEDIFGCPVLFGRAQNQFRFDAVWLDGAPHLGNQITHSEVIELSEGQLEEFQVARILPEKSDRFLQPD